MLDILKFDSGELPWRLIVWDFETNESAIVGAGHSDGETVPIAIVHDDNPHAWLLVAAGQLRAELDNARQLLERINTAFYGDGTAKALRPVMAETKPLLANIRAALAAASAE